MTTIKRSSVMGDYYKDELKKLGNPREGYTPSIKITGSTTYTNDMSLSDESATVLVNWLSEHYNITPAPVIPAHRRTTIDTKYTHFCVSKKTGKIIDGWEYPVEYSHEDVMEFYKIDMRDNDRKLKDYQLELAVTLFKRGINPYDSDNWGKSWS